SERRIYAVLLGQALDRGALLVVADAVEAFGHGARRAIVIQRGEDPAADVQVAEAAREVILRGVVVVSPLVEAVLAPELRVAVVRAVGHDVVVADLAPRVDVPGELGLWRNRARQRIDFVAVGGQLVRVDGPLSEAAAPVAR